MQVPQFRTRQVESIYDVGVQAWDTVAQPSGFYSSASWLLAYEQDRHATVRYIVVEDEAGVLAATLPVYEVSRESNDRYDPMKLGMTDAHDPFRVLGSRRGYRSSVLLSPSLNEDARNAATGAIRSELATIHATTGSSLYWAFVPDEQLHDVVCCGGSPTANEVGVEAFLALPIGGFDEYSAGLAHRRRAKVRAERRRFLTVGYDVSFEALPDVVSEAAPLLAQLEQKYGSTNDETYYHFYFKRFVEALDPGMVVTCRLDRRLVGFCLFFSFGGTIWARVAGFDYPNLRNAFEYFNLTFYELLEYGAHNGAQRLHLGMESLEAKTNRGATTHSLWATRFSPEPRP